MEAKEGGQRRWRCCFRCGRRRGPPSSRAASDTDLLDPHAEDVALADVVLDARAKALGLGARAQEDDERNKERGHHEAGRQHLHVCVWV